MPYTGDTLLGIPTGEPPAWTHGEAVALCREVQRVCLGRGDVHVALTGGCLYGDGPRKDCDLLFYRVRQVDGIDLGGLLADLESIGLVVISHYGWVYKALYGGRQVDLLFPDVVGLGPGDAFGY